MKSNIKVLHIINSLNIGGAEKLIVDGVSHYQNKIKVVDTLILKETKSSFEQQLEQNSRGEIFYLTTKSLYNPFLILKIIPYLKKYDLVHAHLFPTLYWVVIAKLFSFSKVKLIYTEHSTHNRRRDHFILKRLDRFIYSKIDFIGCISKGTYDELVNHIGDRGQKGIVYNGINLKSYSNLRKSEKYLFFKGSKNKIIIQVSSFRPQKDQKTLINAMSVLPEDYKLILVGDGQLKSECIRQVSDLGLEDRILFLGLRSDIPELLFNSDIVVLSSHYEGFGLAVVEGMAANKPVIATNIDGVKEIVENYGLLFEKQNSSELAENILSLGENKEYYDKISQQCYQRSNDFSINSMVDFYCAEYQKLMLK